MSILNLTPHEIRFVRPEGEDLVLPPSGTVARVSVSRVYGEETHLAIPVFTTQAGEVQGLPAPRPGVVCVVSRAVVDAARDRKDIFFPDDLVRDDQGRVIGARALGRLA